MLTGALTKGDRRAATGADLTEFNYDSPYGRHALRTMYSAICSDVLVPGLVAGDLMPDGQNFYVFNGSMKVRHMENLFVTVIICI